MGVEKKKFERRKKMQENEPPGKKVRQKWGEGVSSLVLKK